LATGPVVVRYFGQTQQHSKYDIFDGENSIAYDENDERGQIMSLKQTRLSFQTIVAILLFTGCCLCSPNIHYVRIVSSVSDGALIDFRVGMEDFGTVVAGVATEYKSIPRATELAMTFGLEETAIGNVSVDGLGTHYWTITVSGTLTDMNFIITEDDA
jgi:hypothetical protein